MDESKINHIVYNQLIENSTDFLINAAETLKANNNRGFDSRLYDDWEGHKLKSAFLSITTALELLLKAILCSHDWKLIFSNPQNANLEDIQSGKFYSLNFDKCVSTINKICNFKIEDRYNLQIEFIRDERNKLVHYQNVYLEDNYIELISKGISVFLEIYRDFVKSIFMPNYLNDIDYSLINVKRYVDIRLDSLQFRLKQARRPKSIHFSSCPKCGLDAITFKNNDYIKCVFCNYEGHVEEEASVGNEYGIECPICFKKTMVLIYYSDINNTLLNCVYCNHVEKNTTNNK